MKKIIVFISFLLFTICSNSQPLLMQEVSAAEKKEGVAFKFKYSDKHSYGLLVLYLFSDNRFLYQTNSFGVNLSSKGTWQRQGSELLLNSDVQKADLPVSISYIKDTSGLAYICPFLPVRNSCGEELKDVFVFVNTDTSRCLPSYYTCYGNFRKADSVKLVFDNGISSRWTVIRQDVYDFIVITVDAGFLPGSYFPINNRRYKVYKNRIQLINQ